jgi:hypothetical protein
MAMVMMRFVAMLHKVLALDAMKSKRHPTMAPYQQDMAEDVRGEGAYRLAIPLKVLMLRSV